MTLEKALNIIAGQCSKKEHCSKEVREKLRKWELAEEAIEKIMTFLFKHQFVDDARYARIYAEDKFRFNHWGKQKIAQMLHYKGISPEMITDALEILNNAAYTESCLNILEQKLKSLPALPPYELRGKLTRFALSRGFDFDTINACLQKLL